MYRFLWVIGPQVGRFAYQALATLIARLQVIDLDVKIVIAGNLEHAESKSDLHFFSVYGLVFILNSLDINTSASNNEGPVKKFNNYLLYFT